MVEQTFTSGAEKVSDGVQDITHAAKEMASEKIHDASKAIHQYSDQASNVIKAHPMTSVLVAFGTGIVLSMLLFKRS